jgi:hypothetical protein
VQLLETENAGAFELKSMAASPLRQGEGMGRRLIEAALVPCRASNERPVDRFDLGRRYRHFAFLPAARFRAYVIVGDAFGPSTGYTEGALVDGIPLRNQMFLDFDLSKRGVRRELTKPDQVATFEHCTGPAARRPA